MWQMQKGDAMAVPGLCLIAQMYSHCIQIIHSFFIICNSFFLFCTILLSINPSNKGKTSCVLIPSFLPVDPSPRIQHIFEFMSLSLCAVRYLSISEQKELPLFESTLHENVINCQSNSALWVNHPETRQSGCSHMSHLRPHFHNKISDRVMSAAKSLGVNCCKTDL